MAAAAVLGNPCTVPTAVAVAAILMAEAFGYRPCCWLAKPLASIGFLLAALAAGARASAYGRSVLAAQFLGFVGDVLLLSEAQSFFALGLTAFLLGHLAFVAGFLHLGLDWRATATASAAVAPLAVAAGRWLWPGVQRTLRGPVAAYIIVISGMLATAVGAVTRCGTDGGQLGLGGAVAFFVSDLFVARERFKAKGFINKAIGLPAYYAAQLMFAASVDACGQAT